MIGASNIILAMPAPKKVVNLLQPDGSQVIGRMIGDEFFHYALSEDNYVLLSNDKGFYTYAVRDSSGNLKPGETIARNLTQRQKKDLDFLKTISPNMTFSEKQLDQSIEKRIRKSSKKSILLRGSNNADVYPTSGNVKSVVILVNFSNLSFKTENAGSFFTDMFNKKGFDYGNHIGSLKDYFNFNSSGKFNPEFAVVGPVTLDSTYSYYGQNDANNDDLHAAQMAYEACIKASGLVDFSLFDADQNGSVDNIYIYYAGKSEADGGSADMIWPHAWALSGENYVLNLNGKDIENYACSSELQGNGSITGIGTFAHEYSHILGLADSYDTDYITNGQSFDIGEWSLMSYGGYNADGEVPPSLTLIERQMLGWVTPIELNDVTSGVKLPPLDSSNIGYKINTSNPGEFYLLENRQQRKGSWDEYLYHHGMLVFHIDMRNNTTTKISYDNQDYDWTFKRLWDLNLINAISSHQCMDIVEADNTYVIYNGANKTSYINSVKGDPFPGTRNLKSFTDETVPSMKTWSGSYLNSPITNISEQNGIISFDFKVEGGFDTKKPVIKSTTEIEPFKFTANWKSLYGATGYKIEIFKIEISDNGNSLKTQLTGYDYSIVDSFIKINDLDDESIYQFRIVANNGFINSKYSDYKEVKTPNATVMIAYVNDRTIYLKGNDKGSVFSVYNLSGTELKTTYSNHISVSRPGIYFVKSILNGQSKVIKVLVN